MPQTPSAANQERADKDSVKKLAITEDFKSVVDRQKYVTDLAKDVFNSFTKIYISLVAGVFALLSLSQKLNLQEKIYHTIVDGVFYLILIIGTLTILQILIALWRWWFYRNEEFRITENPKRKPELVALLFELCFCIAIIALMWGAYEGKDRLDDVIENIVIQETKDSREVLDSNHCSKQVD